MTDTSGATVRWKKSSFSGGDNGDCVELGNTGGVRDSKNPDGPRLRVDLGGLLAAVKGNRLTR
ncbi:MAG: DUF397 domain-containing protein [Actinophytocola sp.]|uniref:DUF397 domain-containing protein n=1 Tax=Actinophytocola sp. TaxID=1872138 RepID=UPI003C74EFEE